jgi:hypothetical protein
METDTYASRRADGIMQRDQHDAHKQDECAASYIPDSDGSSALTFENVDAIKLMLFSVSFPSSDGSCSHTQRDAEGW